jgi:adenylylsulfate kinase-like enzyme
MIYWFIGQPGCGKSTLAKTLKKEFNSKGIDVVHLDGDDLRVIFGGLYKTEHFTKEYRENNTRTLQKLVEHIASQGVFVIVSTVNSNRALREELKTRNKKMVEIYVVNSGPHVREDRHYKDFEPPLEQFVFVDTNGLTPDEALKSIWTKL